VTESRAVYLYLRFTRTIHTCIHGYRNGYNFMRTGRVRVRQ